MTPVSIIQYGVFPEKQFIYYFTPCLTLQKLTTHLMLKYLELIIPFHSEHHM